MTDAEKLIILEGFFWRVADIGAVTYEASQVTGSAYIHAQKLIDVLNSVESDWYKLTSERRREPKAEVEETHNNEH